MTEVYLQGGRWVLFMVKDSYDSLQIVGPTLQQPKMVLSRLDAQIAEFL
jgi:hypothetical protein